MAPTLRPGDRVVVLKTARAHGAATYGDVVVFPWPGRPEQALVKRIVGMPADLIEVRDGAPHDIHAPNDIHDGARPPLPAPGRPTGPEAARANGGPPDR